jgi:hypothetical protein
MEGDAMTPALEENLYLAFPTLFPPRKTMAEGGREPFELYGFDVGDGWYQLIYEAAEKIAPISPDIRCVQIKEKFGALRFYVEGDPGESWDPINRALDDATIRSACTCEECGSEGEIRSGGWLRTLCPTHEASRHVKTR